MAFCQARSIRMLHELGYMGLVKYTGRKQDHVMRTVFEIGRFHGLHYVPQYFRRRTGHQTIEIEISHSHDNGASAGYILTLSVQTCVPRYALGGR